VVREKNPRVHRERPRFDQTGQTDEDVGAIRFLREDGTQLGVAHHHVMEDARGVEAGLARHGWARTMDCAICQCPGLLSAGRHYAWGVCRNVSQYASTNEMPWAASVAGTNAPEKLLRARVAMSSMDNPKLR